MTPRLWGRPIRTAPRNTRVLVLVPDYSPEPIIAQRIGNLWVSAEGPNFLYPTRWRPIPR